MYAMPRSFGLILLVMGLHRECLSRGLGKPDLCFRRMILTEMPKVNRRKYGTSRGWYKQISSKVLACDIFFSLKKCFLSQTE